MYKKQQNENQVLRNWYGDSVVSLIDADFSKYMLLYQCKSLYYGLKTEETSYIIARQTNIDQNIVDKFNQFLNSIDYNGEKLQKVDHDPKICLK